MSRVIAHLDLDAFYASVELQRRPELKGRPVIVCGTGPRAVVTTASYEARRFGVGSAMPAARAKRLCPDAITIPPDFEAYRSVSGRVMDLVRATVDDVEVMGLDEAYLDLSGMHSPKAAMRRLVAQIREQTGMHASVGIGPNKVVAKVASDAEKPQGFVVLSREQACARFGGRPVTLVPGIGTRTAERLAELGLRTLAELARADEEMLVGRFGANQGPWLRRRAAFHGSSRVEPVRAAVSESRETTFDEDIADLAQLEGRLRGLAAELCAGLRQHGHAGRTVAIKVRLDDWTTVTRARTLPEATDEVATVAEVAVELLRQYAPARPVRLLGVRMASFAGQAEAAVDDDDDEGARDAVGQLVLPL